MRQIWRNAYDWVSKEDDDGIIVVHYVVGRIPRNFAVGCRLSPQYDFAGKHLSPTSLTDVYNNAVMLLGVSPYQTGEW
jgi:hypothetical protein